MGTTAEKFAYLAGTKSAIAAAITAKGVAVADTDTFRSYANKIGEITTSSGGGDVDYLVQFIGYRGEVLQTGRYSTGDVVTAPDDPSYDGLVFDGWSSPVTITDGTVTVGNSDITIGAMFDTVSGATEIDITLTPVTGLTATIALFNNVTSIDWGDGDTSTALGSHAYSDYGDYTIKVYASGDMSDGTSTSNLFGTVSSSAPNCYCTEVRFSGVTSVGARVFYNCRSLTNLTLPDSITSIGSNAFYSCYSLANLTLPNSVTSIGSNAFSYCAGLTSVTLPNSVTSIPDSMFFGCYSLTSVTIGDSITSIGTNAFYNCYSLANLTLLNSVTSIGSNAFYGCYSLANLTLSNSVTSIGTSAFSYCHSLPNLTLPNSVTSIGTSAFIFCSKLTSITLPNSVTSIGTSAFSYCMAVTEYDLTAYTSTDTVPTLSGTSAFTQINGICKMNFRDQDTLDNFAAATNWSTYANYMYVKEDAE